MKDRAKMLRLRHLAPSMLVAVTGTLGVGAAHAEPGLSLAWDAPLGCPTPGDVTAETKRLLGGQIPAAPPLTARADVALVGPSDYRLRIAIGAGASERPREVHAPTCAELGDAAALLLALAIDPVAVASAPPGGALRSDRGAPPPPPAPEPLPPLMPAPLFFPTNTPPSSQTGALPIAPWPPASGGLGPGGLGSGGLGSGGLRPGVGGPGTFAPGGFVSGGVGSPPSGTPPPLPGTSGSWPTLLNTGTLSTALAPQIPVPLFSAPVFSPPVRRPPLAPSEPAPALRAHLSLAAEAGTFRALSPMLRAGFSIVPTPLRVDASLVLAWGGQIPSAADPEKGGELWLGAGALSACYEAPITDDSPRPVSLAACAGLEAGAITATSYGVTETATGQSPWVAPTAGGLFRWGFARGAALRLDLMLGVPLFHPRFRIEGLGVVHEPAEVVARAGAGVEVDLSGR